MERTVPTTETPAVPQHRWALFVAALSVAGLGFVQIHRVTEPKPEGYPLVVADPSKLDFGERWEGETFTWTVPVRNTTDRAVWVEEFQVSCGCMSVEPRQVLLTAGETRDVTLRITPTIPRETNRATTSTTQVISLFAYGADKKLELLRAHLRGRPATLLTLAPSQFLFERPPVRGETARAVPLTLLPHGDCREIRIDCDPDVRATVRRKDPDYEIAVVIEPKQSGAWSKAVRVSLIDGRGQTIGTRSIAVAPTVVEPVVVKPNHHHFGTVPAGSSADLTIVLSSYTGRPYVVRRVEPSGADITVVRKESPAEYQINWTPSGEGEREASVKFHIQESTGDRFVARIGLAAYITAGGSLRGGE